MLSRILVEHKPMRHFANYIALLGAVMSVLATARAGQQKTEPVYADEHGVIRWTVDDREVALFGANYSLPSACDYRAAGYVGADRKKLVEQDFAHFARMGWDGVRFCFWGDWENCDAKGNLIANHHLDVLDYAIATAAKRGIGVLFTPITTYSSLFPDGKDSPDLQGFSKVFSKDKLGTDPAAIAAQCNYLRQILNHVNPYTGRALKDEPAILFVELINEPTYHDDLAGSVSYIDALADAVRSTGCRKLLFYNLSQDFEIAPAIKASTVPGITFAWYPTGLNGGHALTENYLRTVDDYAPMAQPGLHGAPKIVYEFDSADANSGYMYPAMVRAFRGAGAQFMSMFSYDMLATAPYNLGWQTHFLNLVYTPRKAVSAVIAAEAARTLPLYSRWGDYPANRRFGPFRVSYEEDLSEMVTDTKFLHANSTKTEPPKPGALEKIVGIGSSPIVSYEGNGAYFLDRISAGVWRLELYPDAVTVHDPFAGQGGKRTIAVRLIEHAWPMTIRLPDLGETFSVEPLNAGNSHHSAAHAGQFEARPGVYLLSRNAAINRSALPATVGGIGLDEYVCPPSSEMPAQMIPEPREVYPVESPATFAVAVLDSKPPRQVTFHWRVAGETEFHIETMKAAGGYRFSATIGASEVHGPAMEYFYTAECAAGAVRFPTGEGETLQSRFVSRADPVALFVPEADGAKLAYTRIGDTIRHGIYQRLPANGSDPAALRIFLQLSRDASLDDYTASLSVKTRLAERELASSADGVIHLKARGSREGQKLHLTLVESDGTSWSAAVELGADWKDLAVPVRTLRLARGVLLPLGYPLRWNYWVTPAQGRGGPGDGPRLASVEHLQFSLRPERADRSASKDPWIDISSVSLVFDSHEPAPN